MGSTQKVKRQPGRHAVGVALTLLAERHIGRLLSCGAILPALDLAWPNAKRQTGPSMTKAKPKSVIQVADGRGDMARVEDHRFKRGWPISFQVSTDEDQADGWLRYFAAELQHRGWSASGIDQLDRKENSGSRTVSTGTGNPQFAIRWERRRGGSLKIDARPIGSPEISCPGHPRFC
jgi:hypothetical protein